MKIGVFDSGVGGLSVAGAIQQSLPEVEVLYTEDRENVPYGNKEPNELLKLVLPILTALEEQGCEVIVIACNTVTTTIIEQLRQNLKIPLIGMEPMVKPAALASKSKIIAVCATPTTLASNRYKWLKDEYATGVKVLEPDCSDWALMIEGDRIDHEKVATRIEEVISQGADKIVLGCTHYHWIEDIIIDLAKGRADVLQPEQPVITQLRKTIADLRRL